MGLPQWYVSSRVRLVVGNSCSLEEGWFKKGRLWSLGQCGIVDWSVFATGAGKGVRRL